MGCNFLWISISWSWHYRAWHSGSCQPVLIISKPLVTVFLCTAETCCRKYLPFCAKIFDTTTVSCVWCLGPAPGSVLVTVECHVSLILLLWLLLLVDCCCLWDAVIQNHGWLVCEKILSLDCSKGQNLKVVTLNLKGVPHLNSVFLI